MPSTTLRQSVLRQSRRLVVKVGTQLLTINNDRQPTIDTRFIGRLARQIAAFQKQGYEMTLVTSGAIGAGCMELGLPRRPRDVADLQAVAAVGQRKLMSLMHNAFHRAGVPVGQLLLTRQDFDDRMRFLNIRNCIAKLHELGAIPILNENDTVAVDEIRFGDNDMLAALTCNALRADALLLLTVVDGLLDDKGQRIDLVDNVGDFLRMVRQSRSDWGSGGMSTKLEAARLVTQAGEIAVIANGRVPRVLEKLMIKAESLGTVFVPAQRKLDSRSRWIGLTARPAGTITIDDGAVRAICQRNKSLLASGVCEMTGNFAKGDVLLVRDGRGMELARGLSNYAAQELRLIMGKRSSEFEKILGRRAYAEVIHRDNLVLRG